MQHLARRDALPRYVVLQVLYAEDYYLHPSYMDLHPQHALLPLHVIRLRLMIAAVFMLMAYISMIVLHIMNEYCMLITMRGYHLTCRICTWLLVLFA